MKVKDLIEQLQKLDPDLMIVVDGYEGGLMELKKCEESTALLNQNNSWYYGDHEDCHPSAEGAVKVCYLPR